MKKIVSSFLALCLAASWALVPSVALSEPTGADDVPVVVDPGQPDVVVPPDLGDPAAAPGVPPSAAVTVTPPNPTAPPTVSPIPGPSPVLPSTPSPARPLARPPGVPGAPTNASRFNFPRPNGRPVGPNPLAAPGSTPAVNPAANPAANPASATPTGVSTGSSDGDDSTDIVNFKNMPLEQFLDEYSMISKRTVLRASGLPAQSSINFRPASPLTPEERLQMYDTILALNGITMIPTGEKAVLAVPTAQAMQEGAAFANKRVEDYAEASQFVTHVIKVEHIPVQEAAETLKQFAKNQNGIVALESTKTLILRDYAINVKRMLEVLKRVDVEVEQEYQFEVFPVKFGKVEDLYQTLQSVIGGGGGGAMPASTGGRSNRGGGFGGGGLGGGFGGGLGNSGRSSSGYGNRSSGNYYGQSEGMEPLMPQQAAVARAPGAAGGAGTFQGRLNNVNRAGGLGQNPAQPLLNEASITPDPRSNSLIVYASRRDMAQLRKIIEKVDTLLAQVLIEGVIMEVGLTSGLSYGVSARQKYKNFNDTVGGGGTMDNLNGFSGLTNIFPTIPTGGGLNYLLRFNQDIDVIIKALASDGNVNILQRPRIITSHATEATFFAGQTVPFVQGSYNNGGGLVGTSNFYDRQNVGVELTVLPYITPDGLVVMEVQQVIEEIAPKNGGIETVANAPVTNKRQATSTISVHSGESVLLGGYIRASKGTSKSGIPLLKDIPLLGALFRSTDVDKSRTELMILMRPTVLPTPEAAAKLTKQYQQDSPQIRMLEQDFAKEREKLNRAAERQMDSSGNPGVLVPDAPSTPDNTTPPIAP